MMTLRELVSQLTDLLKYAPELADKPVIVSVEGLPANVEVTGVETMKEGCYISAG